MRERLIELLIDGLGESEILPHLYGEPMGTDFQKFADYLTTHDCYCFPDGVKIGRSVWRITTGEIQEATIEKLIVKLGGYYMKLSVNSVYETSCRQIGKTVFLTKEEAEAALERSKQ